MHTDHVPENNAKETGRAAANEPAPRKTGKPAGPPFVDQRPGAVAQRKLQELADLSTRAKYGAVLPPAAHDRAVSPGRPSQPPAIQRAIDEGMVERVTARLGLEPAQAPAIVEVPDNPEITGGTPFKDYPANAKRGLTGDQENLTLVGVNRGGDAEKSAYENLDAVGGAGYIFEHGLALIKAGIENYERNLLHEAGHHKQKGMGINPGNTNQKLLEYHNVLFHENLFGGDFRVAYVQDSTMFWVERWEKADTPVKKTELIEKYTKTAGDALSGMDKFMGEKGPNNMAVYEAIKAKLTELEGTAGGDLEKRFALLRFRYNLAKEVRMAM